MIYYLQVIEQVGYTVIHTKWHTYSYAIDNCINHPAQTSETGKSCRRGPGEGGPAQRALPCPSWMLGVEWGDGEEEEGGEGIRSDGIDAFKSSRSTIRQLKLLIGPRLRG